MAEESKAKKKNEVAIFDVKKFSIAQLPELQNKKEEIAAIIEANPIVEIVDTETYEQAKKSRTAVKTLRTGTEKEQAEVKKNVKIMVMEAIDQEYNSIVTDIKSEEKKRQDIVTAYEDKKQAEKDEKDRKEKERIQTIKDTIDNYATEWKTAFNLMVFDTIEEVGANFLESYTDFDLTILEEFETLFPAKIQELTEYLSEKTISLTDAEKSRSTKVIGEWYVAWGGKLFSMCFENAEGIAKLFKEQEKPTFPIQEFQDDFEQKFKEIESQISTKQTSLLNEKALADKAAKEKEEADKKEAVAKAEREKLENDKAEFAKQQEEAKEKSDFQIKIDNRINQLTDLELKFDLQSTFVGFGFLIDVLDVKTYDDEKWNELISKIENKKSTPSPEILHGIKSEEKALKLVQNIVPTKNLEVNEVLEPEVLPINVCTSLEESFAKNQFDTSTKEFLRETPLTPEECFVAPTWDSIAEEFKTSGEKSYYAWLKSNYNVPTKIQ